LFRGRPDGADFVYLDRLGRLVGVVDPVTNQVAIYRYDAVGNLLSIARQSAAVVSIIDFTPSNGPAGATVAISGTGFSATAGQNTVSFNGAAATVVTSSPTRIVATVPAAATTGPITVTAPGGTGTSDRPFTVGTPGAPTIANISPTIGTPGTAVTISGTNFDAPAKDRVIFNTNIRLASVSAATATTIQTAVPSAVGSGRITVATPQGQALSAQDFFVPPSPYTAAKVAAAERIALGSSRAVTFAAAGTVALLVFDAVTGQRLGFAITGVTVAETDISIRNRDGTILGASTLVTTAGAVLYPPQITSTGTYSIVIAPRNTNTGSLTVAAAAVSATLSASPANVVAGGAVVASWSGITFPTTSGDWIGLYAPGAADTPSLSWRYTTGTASGYVPIPAPSGLTPGTYELRLFGNNGYIRLATTTVSVTACQSPALSAFPTVVPGTTVTAIWTVCAPTTTDWIGLYTPGAPDSPSLSWGYTTGAVGGSIPITVPSGLAAGTYELRLFAHNSYTRLATSNAVTLTRPDLTPTALVAYREVWASSAVASSEYGATNWSASQAAGPPNVASCGDNASAWAPSISGGAAEWLQASFSTPVSPLGVLVHETYSAGFVYRVDLVDTAGVVHPVWTGTDTTACGDWFSVRFAKTSYLVSAVKVYTQKPGYEEIDAVALITDDPLVVPAMTPARIAVAWTVNDSGAGDAVSPWSDTVYISSSSVCCSGATSLGSFSWTTTLSSGSSYTQTKSVTIPALATGTYYLIVRTDSGSAVADTNRANNDYAVPLTISP
jgi:hypothetical protein